MNKQTLIYAQLLEEARHKLPKLSDSPSLETESAVLAESLQYYVDMLRNKNTTAVDLGRDTEQHLNEISRQIGQIATQLATGDSEVRNTLIRVGYYDD